MTAALVAVLCGAGVALVMVGFMLRARDRERDLTEILDLPFGERDVPVEAVSESHPAIIEGTIGLAGRVVTQFDAKGSLARSLERARIPMRPGEYVVIVALLGFVATAFTWILTGHWAFAGGAAVAAPFAGAWFPKMRIRRRRKAFEAQLPDALSLIASSLSAGHTFLRAIQMMCEESDPPLSEEFARVVQETRLGDPLVDALEKLAVRLEVRDLEWVVQAIRIQQTVGGRLADLLHTLADYIRDREEVRREVAVLTAEGRISAWILGAVPVFLLFSMQVMSPGYLTPMFQGWGPVVLGVTAASVVTGVATIRRMARLEV